MISQLGITETVSNKNLIDLNKVKRGRKSSALDELEFREFGLEILFRLVFSSYFFYPNPNPNSR